MDLSVNLYVNLSVNKKKISAAAQYRARHWSQTSSSSQPIDFQYFSSNSGNQSWVPEQ
jgi:hypothetical protein